MNISKERKEMILSFNLPTYREIPAVGLYLDQVSKYINECFNNNLNYTITTSMISNYVKHDIIANPIKKQYGRDQIAYLLFITLTKSVLSLDDLKQLLRKQGEICECETAYNLFSESFNESLHAIFEKNGLDFKEASTWEKDLLNTIVNTIVHQIYLSEMINEFKYDS